MSIEIWTPNVLGILCNSELWLSVCLPQSHVSNFPYQRSGTNRFIRLLGDTRVTDISNHVVKSQMKPCLFKIAAAYIQHKYSRFYFCRSVETWTPSIMWAYHPLCFFFCSLFEYSAFTTSPTTQTRISNRAVASEPDLAILPTMKMPGPVHHQTGMSSLFL